MAIARPRLFPKIASLFVANATAYALIGLSYLLYSRLLTPAQFGLYSAALAIGNLGQQLLDAGIRNTIIKSDDALSEESQGTLFSLMFVGSLALVAVLALAGGPVARLVPSLGVGGYLFLASFAAVYLVSYPLISFPTARLERALRYERIAWVESGGQVIERVLPAFLLLTGAGLMAFVVGLCIGRLFKIAVLAATSWVWPRIPTPARVRAAGTHLVEGAWFRLGVGISLLRDSLHVLVLGPLFGAAWVGYYGWALQLSLLTSQAFVQISARVSLPVFAQTQDPRTRWHDCLHQTEVLAALTGPVLGAALVAAPAVNVMLFHSRWTQAIGLLPFLFVRMLPSIAITLVANLLLVDLGSRAYARAMAVWTVLELVALVPCLVLTGPMGLALSYAIVGWPALAMIIEPLRQYGPRRWADVFGSFLLRRGVLVGAVGAAVCVPLQPWFVASLGGHLAALGTAALLVLVAYAWEPEVRRTSLSMIARAGILRDDVGEQLG